jgi:hypothetical protein
MGRACLRSIYREWLLARSMISSLLFGGGVVMYYDVVVVGLGSVVSSVCLSGRECGRKWGEKRKILFT